MHRRIKLSLLGIVFTLVSSVVLAEDKMVSEASSPKWSIGVIGGTTLFSSEVGLRGALGGEFSFLFMPDMSIGVLIKHNVVETAEGCASCFPDRKVTLWTSVAQLRNIWKHDAITLGAGANAGMGWMYFSAKMPVTLEPISHLYPVLCLGPTAAIEYEFIENLSIGAEANVMWISGNAYHLASDLLGTLKVRW